MKDKKKIVPAAFTILGLLVTVVQIVTKVNDYAANKELLHFFGESAQYITDLSTEEQAELLAVFDIVVPEKEDGAYISAFGKIDYNENYSVCFIEFDSVDSYQAFYDSNKHREPSNNQTTNDKGDIYLTYAERITPASEEGKQNIAVLFEEYSEKRK